VLLGLAVTRFEQKLSIGVDLRHDQGGFQQIVLNDHSTLELNTDTEVRVAMTRSLREVKLIRARRVSTSRTTQRGRSS